MTGVQTCALPISEWNAGANNTFTQNTSNVYQCINISDSSSTFPATDGTGANNTIGYMGNQLGQSGLAGWTPAIIAISVGLMFLGAFMIGRGGRKY